MCQSRGRGVRLARRGQAETTAVDASRPTRPRWSVTPRSKSSATGQAQLVRFQKWLRAGGQGQNMRIRTSSSTKSTQLWAVHHRSSSPILHTDWARAAAGESRIKKVKQNNHLNSKIASTYKLVTQQNSVQCPLEAPLGWNISQLISCQTWGIIYKYTWKCTLHIDFWYVIFKV